ncbi:SprB repeat-containing protein [Gillisia limnaea]|uniref:Uncharacterized protein n=1 Tax=Gillisia limnaea (strain DSM 15749 / LMG 21470 / R-8282) TaxID=865937 RepID=H2BX38_GILLR|nr:SprB repeat-containing protein [Gillisia limnaea]EHQ01990.1 hypothetical protein Gilli_1324 [Gillisia limnaea DSM 15749]
MGKITPRVKVILVLIAFLGFTNFILSETTKFDLSKIVHQKIFLENIGKTEPLANKPVETAQKGRTGISPISPLSVNGLKMSSTTNEELLVKVQQISPVTCSDNADGVITMSVSGGTSPYKYSWSNGPTTKDLNGVPAGTYNLTVTDNNGNTDTAKATVTVEDNIAPNAVAKNITVQLNASGNTSIAAANIDNGSSDACGIASMSVVPNTFGCSNIGSNTVTLTVTDNNGKTSTATSTVTVEDNVAPNTVAKSVTVQLDASGNASITAADIDNGSSDACGIASMSVVPNTFGCSNIGSNTVTLTVTDNKRKNKHSYLNSDC